MPYDPDEKDHRAIRDERKAEADVSTLVELWEATYRPLTIDERLALYDNPLTEQIIALRLSKVELTKCVQQSRKLGDILKLGTDMKESR